MAHTVIKTGSGKSKVEFTCPTCSAPLESPLEEAGKSFPCPTCGKQFVTPGADELKQQVFEETKRVEREMDAAAASAALQKANAEARRIDEMRARDRRAANAVRKSSGERGTAGVPASMFVIALIVSGMASYFCVALPLQARLTNAETTLAATTAKVESLQTDLNSLKATVDYNANIANLNNMRR